MGIRSNGIRFSDWSFAGIHIEIKIEGDFTRSNLTFINTGRSTIIFARRDSSS